MYIENYSSSAPNAIDSVFWLIILFNYTSEEEARLDALWNED